jgi:hypothetical protein
MSIMDRARNFGMMGLRILDHMQQVKRMDMVFINGPIKLHMTEAGSITK